MPPEPTVLAFDTSAAYCAAALLSGGRIVASAVEPMQKGQAERLLPLLTELLDRQGLSFPDLDAVGVGTGPGNFTGIRISVSAARGLAMGLGIPAIGVSGFEARSFETPPPFICLIPAPREQVYRQDFSESGTSEPVLQSAVDARDFAESSGWKVISDEDPSNIVENIARIAALQFGTATNKPAPLYIRPADAAPPKTAAPRILP